MSARTEVVPSQVGGGSCDPFCQAHPERPETLEFRRFAVYPANLALGRAYKPILDAVGLAYTQSIALAALSEEDDQKGCALRDKLFLESNTPPRS